MSAAAGNGTFATLLILPVNENGESYEDRPAVIHPACVAVCGKLLRIDDCFSNDGVGHIQFLSLPGRCLEPFIERVGEVRLIRDESSNGIIILSAEPNDDLASKHPLSPTHRLPCLLKRAGRCCHGDLVIILVTLPSPYARL